MLKKNGQKQTLIKVLSLIIVTLLMFGLVACEKRKRNLLMVRKTSKVTQNRLAKKHAVSFMLMLGCQMTFRGSQLRR